MNFNPIYYIYINVIILVFEMIEMSTQTQQQKLTKCSMEDVNKMDELSARFISLTKYQRKFPETDSKLNGYCR